MKKKRTKKEKEALAQRIESIVPKHEKINGAMAPLIAEIYWVADKIRRS